MAVQQDRIRVVRVIARMNVGGPALQVTTLTQDLDPDRFEQHLLVGSVGTGEADYVSLRAGDLPLRRIEGLGRSVRATGDLAAMRTIRRVIREVQPHIVHTHTAKAGVLGRLAAWSAGAPHTVHTFHGHLLHGYFRPPVEAAVRLTEAALARRTTRLVAVGARVRDELIAAGVGRPDQYVVVAPGVDLPPAPSKPEARNALGVGRDVPVVAFVGRLTSVKRPDRLAEVILGLGTTRPDLVALITGEGELLEALRRDLAPLGDRALFLGWRSDVERVYAAADLVLLTSDNEGMPVSAIEASSCGRPVVCTDVGSTREVVLNGHTGFVTSTEVRALVDAAGRLLDDPALAATMGEAAAAHASAVFGRRRLVDDTADLYESLMGSGGRP